MPASSVAPCNFASAQSSIFENLSARRSQGAILWRKDDNEVGKKKIRIPGETWVLHFRTTRKSDCRRVENKIPIGLVRDLLDKQTAWAELERLHLLINPVDSRRGVTFGDLVLHYTEHELVERSESIHPKAHTTIKGYDRVLRTRLLLKWGNRIALG
jgi:hypothetical protein